MSVDNPNYRVYSQKIGQKGTIYMIDTGSYCTFYLQVDDPTFTKKLSIRYGFPSSIASKDETITYPVGGSMFRTRSDSVFTSGECFFTIRDTGTPQLGKGGTLKVQVSRNAKVPPPPVLYSPNMISATAANISWNNRGAHDAGGYITQIDIGYGDNKTKPKTILNKVKSSTGTALMYSGDHTVTGLKTNTLYYFFVRARTKAGAGPWSEARGILTSGGVKVKHKNEWRNAVPYVKHKGTWKLARAYFKKGGVWGLTR